MGVIQIEYAEHAQKIRLEVAILSGDQKDHNLWGQFVCHIAES